MDSRHHRHHSKPHKEEHLKSSETLRDIVIGMSDGLTVPFALAAGLSAAVSSTSIIVFGGIVTIRPYFVVDHLLLGLKISVAVTLLCRFVLGYFKSKMTGVPPFAGAIKVMFIGAVAAGAAFGVAKLFE